MLKPVGQGRTLTRPMGRDEDQVRKETPDLLPLEPDISLNEFVFVCVLNVSIS
jgi:hypothetical protein